jgi:hypothetical protein
MEHLISDLKEVLIARRENVYTKIQKLEKESDKDLILISSGKLIELDFIIKAFDEMISYSNRTKKFIK